VNALNGLDKDGRYTNTLEESVKAAYHVSTVRPSPMILAPKWANKVVSDAVVWCLFSGGCMCRGSRCSTWR
jgi:hypothetical protein